MAGAKEPKREDTEQGEFPFSSIDAENLEETKRQRRTKGFIGEFIKWLPYIFSAMSVVIVLVIGFAIYDTPKDRLKEQLELGQRYLEEMKYEEAIVAFSNVVEIDPMCVEAYLGIADAYVGIGDDNAALKTLIKGYDETGDERIKVYIEKIKGSSIDIESETVPDSAGNKDGDVNWEEILEVLRICKDNRPQDNGCFLTYEQLEIAYRPFADRLEAYLSTKQDNEEIWETLAQIYLYLGEMEKCLDTRKKGYEITGNERLKAEIHKNIAVNAYEICDEWGRRTEIYYYEGVLEQGKDGVYEHVYGEGGRWVKTIERTSDNSSSIVDEYEYDEYGRVVMEHRIVKLGDNIDEIFDEFEYEGEFSVLRKYRIEEGMNKGHWQIDRITYDKYGQETDVNNLDSWVNH